VFSLKHNVNEKFYTHSTRVCPVCFSQFAKWYSSNNGKCYSPGTEYAKGNDKQSNPLDSEGNYSATSNNTKLVHWPLMGGLLHLVQRGGDWAGCGQCTNHCIAIWRSIALRFYVAIKGLTYSRCQSEIWWMLPKTILSLPSMPAGIDTSPSLIAFM